MEKGATVEDVQEALTQLLLIHLFHPTNEYNLKPQTPQKRSREKDTFGSNSSKRRKLDSSSVINLDDISSSTSEDEPSSPIRDSLLKTPDTPEARKKTSSIFGITLEQEEKLLALILQQAYNSGIPISLDQHLDTFVLPTIKFFKSSDPLRFQIARQRLSEAGFGSDDKKTHLTQSEDHSNTSDSVFDISNSQSDSTPLQASIGHSKSILDGNYSDVTEAAKEMNLPIDNLQEILHLLQLKKQMIFRGPPGTGKSFLARVSSW